MRYVALALALVIATGAGAFSKPKNRAVAIKGFAYAPKKATATLGDTVVWTNADFVPHSVTSDSSVFDSPDLEPKARYTWVASRKGTFSYHCEMHPQMAGTLVVK
jgi:plastocyanin